MYNYLFEKYTSAFEADTLSKISLKEEFDNLLFRYKLPGRHYHNETHLSDIFHLYDQLSLCDSELILAVFYHDVIYEGLPFNYEMRSARYAKNSLTKLNLKSDRIQKIENFILATKHFEPTIYSKDVGLFLDLDLSILGSSNEKYLNYASQIRKENAILPELIYKYLRKRVLNKILKKTFIYHTDFFRQRYEEQARINITGEIIKMIQ